MLATSYRSFLRPVAYLLFAMLAMAVSSSNAAVFRAIWDPTYGSPFPNLGWNGVAEFQVPLSPPCNTDGIACLGSGPTAAYLKSAYVLFYDDTTSEPLAEINLTQAELSGVTINSLLFGGGSTPTQLSTGTFPGKQPIPITPFDDDPYGGFLSYFFALQFAIDLPYNCDGDVCSFFSGPLLLNRLRGGEYAFNDFVANPPRNFTIVQVPEPASLALLLAGLLAVSTARRRQRRTQASPR